MASDLPRFTLRLTEEKLNKLKDIAKKEHRSTNEQINYILDKFITEYESKQERAVLKNNLEQSSTSKIG